MIIKWQDTVPDTEVLTRAGIPSINTLLQKAQMRWAGYVTRMPDDRLPNSSCMVRSAPANDQLVGKRNASMIRKPSQDLTSMSSTGKPVPRIDSCGAEPGQLKKTGSRRLRKSVLLARKARLYSTTSTSAGPTYTCPECGRVLQA